MSDGVKLIQVAVAHDGGELYGSDVLEQYFYENSVPVLSRAMDVVIDDVVYTVWNFNDARAAQTIIEEFNGIDVSTLGDEWLKANAFRLTTQVVDDQP